LPGALVNLLTTTPGLRLSVDRREIQNDVSSVVEELLTEAAAELVAERAGLLTAEWLDKIERQSPFVAAIVIERQSPFVAAIVRDALARGASTDPDLH